MGCGYLSACVHVNTPVIGGPPLQIFTIGQRRLIYHETAMNKHSSRSHAVFRIRVVRTPRHRDRDRPASRVSVDSFVSVPDKEWDDSLSTVRQPQRPAALSLPPRRHFSP